MNAVSRLLKQLEQLKQSWLECQQHVRHKIVLSTIELIESWTEVGIVLYHSISLPLLFLHFNNHFSGTGREIRLASVSVGQHSDF